MQTEGREGEGSGKVVSSSSGRGTSSRGPVANLVEELESLPNLLLHVSSRLVSLGSSPLRPSHSFSSFLPFFLSSRIPCVVALQHCPSSKALKERAAAYKRLFNCQPEDTPPLRI